MKQSKEEINQQKDKKSTFWQKLKKVLLFLLKILRWPAVYYGVLIGGFYGLIQIFKMANGSSMLITEVVGKYGILIGAVLAIIMLLAGVLTSALFTDTFLVSTGLAAGMYLLGSLLIQAPDSWGSDYVEFDTMKMYVFIALVAAVLIGDLIVLLVRKILTKRSIRHMTEHT